MSSQRNVLFLIGMGLFLWGCPGFGDEELPATIVDDPTWISDIEPMMEKYCNECHSSPATQGAPGVFRLDECEDTDILGTASITDRNIARIRNAAAPMPPAAYPHQMAEAEMITYQNWVDNGSPCDGKGGPVNNGMNNNNNNNTNNNNGTTPTNNGMTTGPTQWEQVAGIISQGCGAVNCHGKATGNGNFMVTQAATLGEVQRALDNVSTTDGLPLVSPSTPESSELYLRMSSLLPNRQMPPPVSGGALPAVEIETVRSWIAAGAVYE